MSKRKAIDGLDEDALLFLQLHGLAETKLKKRSNKNDSQQQVPSQTPVTHTLSDSENNRHGHHHKSSQTFKQFVQTETHEGSKSHVNETTSKLSASANLISGFSKYDYVDVCTREVTSTFCIKNVSYIMERSEELKTPVFYCRSLPWKILVRTSTTKRNVKYLSVFLECNPETRNGRWSCCAKAQLSLLNQSTSGKPYTRQIEHIFRFDDSEWGLSEFIKYSELKRRAYMQNDSIMIRVRLHADAPHGVRWDSKLHTGFIGLKNQGATCYLNSLLQAFYFTNSLRKAIYEMPTDCDNIKTDVAFSMKKLFYDMQSSNVPVETKRLTRSFGWTSFDAFTQHDVQELSRLLLAKIESKMTGTHLEKTIPKLFEGKMKSYIRCTSVKDESTREESFYDIQLPVAGNKSVELALSAYIREELLTDENKYKTEKYGFQEAKKGLTFVEFPQVLHLQLMRFKYDSKTGCNVKINDRFTYKDELDVSPYISDMKSPVMYRLHAVLVHLGVDGMGHYMAYIDPQGDGQWCKFDDEVVSRCSSKDAIERNFGGEADNVTSSYCSSAYMLVYIRKSELDVILHPVDETVVQRALEEQLEQEKQADCQKAVENDDIYQSMKVEIITEKCFYDHHGHDLFSEDTVGKLISVKKLDTLSQLHTIIAESMDCKREEVRIWPFILRENGSHRPGFLQMENSHETVQTAANYKDTWQVFVEVNKESLPTFDLASNVCLFIKVYESASVGFRYLCHKCFDINIPIDEFIKDLAILARFSKKNKVHLFKEEGLGTIRPIASDDCALGADGQLYDGDIYIIQRDCDQWSPVEYSRKLRACSKISVTFCEKTSKESFVLRLRLDLRYVKLAKKVSAQIRNCEDANLIFYRDSGENGPGLAFMYGQDANNMEHVEMSELRLSDMITEKRREGSPVKLYYEQLNIPLRDLPKKTKFTCLVVSEDLTAETCISLYVDKHGLVKDLLAEAAKHYTAYSSTGSGKLRLVDVLGERIVHVHSTDLELKLLMTPVREDRMLRIEEIPLDEMNVSHHQQVDEFTLDTSLTDSMLVPVAHYDQNLIMKFGVPFLMKIYDGEKFSALVKRLQIKLASYCLNFDKIKFFRVLKNGATIPLTAGTIIRTKEFKCSGPLIDQPWLGLDHMDTGSRNLKAFNQAITI